MQHNINRPSQLREVPANRLAHAAPDPVPFHGPSKHFPDREAHAGTASVLARTVPIESGKVPREAFPSLPVHDLKIRMLQQPRASWKAFLGPIRNSFNSHLKLTRKENYSR
jgi:hypothetical protein